jgi:hypothetical protein
LGAIALRPLAEAQTRPVETERQINDREQERRRRRFVHAMKRFAERKFK